MPLRQPLPWALSIVVALVATIATTAPTLARAPSPTTQALAPPPTLGVVADAAAPHGVRLVQLPQTPGTHRAPLLAWGGFRDALHAEGWTYLAIYGNTTRAAETAATAAAAAAAVSSDSMGEAERAAAATNAKLPASGGTGGGSSRGTSNDLADHESLVAFAAGYVEAALTAVRIHEYSMNKEDGHAGWSPALADYVQRQNAWMRGKVAAYGSTDPWWRQVGLLLQQEAGLVAGYAATAAPGQQLDADALLVLSLHSDMDTLCPLFGCTDVRGRPRVSRRGHCSVIVKSVPERRELYAAHTTWTSFNDMTRVYKLMDLPYSGVAARRLAFSSYPGNLFSTDDYYVTGADLVVTETTIDNHNDSLWTHVVPETVPTWIRTMVANRLARDGKSWAAAFARENSGTYNNEFHVVDYKAFAGASRPGQVPAGTLTIVDQMPGPLNVEVADRSAWLEEHGYWASYNRPGLPATYARANYSALVAAEGDHFSWEKTSRAQLFRALQANATDEMGLRSVMRHNRFDAGGDPLSITHQACSHGPSASNAIAERGDLTPLDAGCIVDIARQNEGAIDLKYATAALIARGTLASIAQSGPTADDQPVFVWSKSPFAEVAHAGQPDVWDFGYVTVEWGTEDS